MSFSRITVPGYFRRMDPDAWQPLVLRLLAICIPLSFALSIPFVSVKRPFQRASQAAHLGLVLAVLLAAAGIAMSGGEAVTTGLPLSAASLARTVRLDVVTRVMLVLVCFLAVIIVRYSRTYLEGDAGQPRYARALLATLAAVTGLLLTNNLLVIGLAWMGTSLALHQLLTFYPERPRALAAAHKKFLLSRLADACMLGAIVLVGLRVGSLEIDTVNAWAQASGAMPPSLQLAAVLLVLAGALKSAQIPFHGWLIQVMEAPTPVSALLHAGIVNIGAFVMIRLAPFMTRAPLAQTLLVVIGTTTAVVAGLVMTSRVSVKVALAWSTCAQMGFMLVECGLGAWHLALLHLVAHSLYKAHAFLSSGTTVDVWRVQTVARPRQPVPLLRVLGASGLVFASVVASVAASVAVGRALGAGPAEPSPTLAPLTILLGLSLSPLVLRVIDGGLRTLVGVVLGAFGVGALYFGGHAAAGRILPFPEPASMPLTWLIVIAGFVLLYGAQLLFAYRPHGRLARALQPRVFAGFYLDEIFTRMTFRLWPPRLPRPEIEKPILRVANTLEAR